MQELVNASLDAAAIAAALARDAVEVHYQPIVLLPGREVVGFEALARIRRPDGRLVAPAGFIGPAQDCGLIGAIGHSVLRQAVAEAARWRSVSGPLATAAVSVNITPTQLESPDIVEEVTAVLGTYQLPASALVLEITESTVAAPTLRPVIERLSSLGIRIAIDDFGTGFATLDTLRRIPAHILKLDRSFVVGVTREGADRAIVRVVADLADSLGMSVVAEGVETEEQAAALLRLGCPAVQGYLFARPGPDPEAVAALAAGGPATPAPAAEGRDRWPVRLDEAVLAAARLLGAEDAEDEVHRGTVHAVAVALGRAAGLDPQAVRVVGRLALVHDVARLAVDGSLPPALGADDRLRSLGGPPRVVGGTAEGGASEVQLVRAAVAAVDRAARRDAALAPEVVAAALAEQATVLRRGGSSLADLLADVAAVPLQVVPFGELVEDLDRRRMGRRGMEERMRSVFGITKVLGSNRDTAELMRMALEEVRRMVGAASASVERWDRDTDALRCLVNVGHLGAGEDTFPVDEVYPLVDYTQARRTMLTGLPYIHRVDDPAGDDEAVALLRSLGKYSSAAVPVYVDGRVWGQLWFATDHGEPPFEARDIETLMGVATLMGGVVVQAEHLQAVDRMAFEDPLTRVGNRRLVDDVLARLAAGEEHVTVALLDIDRLKELNDGEGHAAGDAAIRAVADALSAAVGTWPQATIGRVGGGEFCVVLPGCAAPVACGMLDDALLRLREQTGPTVSLGVACADAAPWEPRDLLAAADGELRRAKRWAHRSHARVDRRRPPRRARRPVVHAEPG